MKLVWQGDYDRVAHSIFSHPYYKVRPTWTNHNTHPPFFMLFIFLFCVFTYLLFCMILRHFFIARAGDFVSHWSSIYHTPPPHILMTVVQTLYFVSSKLFHFNNIYSVTGRHWHLTPSLHSILEFIVRDIEIEAEEYISTPGCKRSGKYTGTY